MPLFKSLKEFFKRSPKEQPSEQYLEEAPQPIKLGLVLSGGGSRAAYQAGALRALAPYIRESGAEISVIVGSSIGAVNGIVFGGSLRLGIDEAVELLEALWLERVYRNTFAGSPSMAFLRAIKTALLKYSSPGPEATRSAIFNPSPLTNRVDQVLREAGGLSLSNRASTLDMVGVMTTIEGETRKPLVFASSKKKLPDEILKGASFDIHYVDELTAKHGMASAALPSILPPVDIDVGYGTVSLVDGGISNNIPVDPAVRFGAERVVILDISGRDWWLKQYGDAPDTRPSWEVPAGVETFCFRPPETFIAKNQVPLGPLLRAAVSLSTKDFIRSLGPTWPIFSILKKKMGEDLAYEVMSYVALHPEYAQALIELGYKETKDKLDAAHKIEFEQSDSYAEWYEAI